MLESGPDDLVPGLPMLTWQNSLGWDKATSMIEQTPASGVVYVFPLCCLGIPWYVVFAISFRQPKH